MFAPGQAEGCRRFRCCVVLAKHLETVLSVQSTGDDGDIVTTIAVLMNSAQVIDHTRQCFFSRVWHRTLLLPAFWLDGVMRCVLLADRVLWFVFHSRSFFSLCVFVPPFSCYLRCVELIVQ